MGNDPLEEGGGFRAWLRVADRYCFGMGSPTTLGVMRILVGFIAFLNWCMIGLDWEAWFSERGYVPEWVARIYFNSRVPVGFNTGWALPRLNLLNGVTDPRITIPFYFAVIVFSLLTCLGLWTRVSAVALAIGTVTLQTRSGPILHGGDTVLRLAVIYLAVAPCGRACSLDRLIGLWKNREPHGPVLVSIWAQRLFQYNIALLYITTIWNKWHGDKWKWPGGAMDATWYTERLAEFYRFPMPAFMRSEWVAHMTTLGTVVTEFCLGTVVFFPSARKWVLLAGVLMHAWIEYSMNIPLFSFIMVSLYLCFFEGHEITAWAERVGLRLRRWHVRVYLPEGRQLSPRAVAFLDAIDPFKVISYLPGEAKTWAAETFDGRALPVARAVGSRSVGAWIFAWLPGLLRKVLDSSLAPVSIGAGELVSV